MCQDTEERTKRETEISETNEISLKLTIRLKVSSYRKENVDHKEKMEVTTIPTVSIKFKLEKDI